MLWSGACIRGGGVYWLSEVDDSSPVPSRLLLRYLEAKALCAGPPGVVGAGWYVLAVREEMSVVKHVVRVQL